MLRFKTAKHSINLICVVIISFYLTYIKIDRMNWLILVPIGVLLVALVIFLIKRNMKDEAAFEKQLNNDYTKPRDEEKDTDAEELTK